VKVVEVILLVFVMGEERSWDSPQKESEVRVRRISPLESFT
jgi:hypothetical protein